ncbi:unnamed protein product [Sphagnum troendelagicum]|uniref:Domain X domain-containing protein n=1 Tax=Sphagnum troendelagicum TaxID=128251 RepID=A0ABP0TWD6_9BRYO
MNPCSSSVGTRLLLHLVGRRYLLKKDCFMGTAGICSMGRVANSLEVVQLVGEEGRQQLSVVAAAAGCEVLPSFCDLRLVMKAELTKENAAFIRGAMVLDKLLAVKWWIPEVVGEFLRLVYQPGVVEVVPFFTGMCTRLFSSSRTCCVDSSKELPRSLSRQLSGTRVEASSERQAYTDDPSEDDGEEDEEEMFEEEDLRDEEEEGFGHRSMDSSSVCSVSKPRLLAPIRDLIAEAVERGYAKENAIGLAIATSQPKYSGAEDSIIVNHYSFIIRSIVNYYSFVHKRSSLWKVICIYKKSCALTLARKHSMQSAAAAFYRFGPNLRILDDEGKEVTSLYYPISLKTTCKFNPRNLRYSEVTILQEPYQKRKRG